jgi:hypothetical protein
MNPEMKLRRIELTTYIKETSGLEGAPLYVVNAMTSKKGNILFKCKGELEGIDLVKVPCTWIPVDLTEQAQRDKLIQCTEFKSLLRKGVIVIVSDQIPDNYKKKGFTDASEALKLPICVQENKDISAGLGLVVHESMPQENEAFDLSSNRLGKDTRAEVNRHASPLAQSLISREMNNDPEETILNAMRTKVLDLTRADLDYILANATGAQIKSFAMETIRSLPEEE